jgi:hypothetical protein
MKFFKALLFASVAVASAREGRIHDHDRSFHEGAAVGTVSCAFPLIQSSVQISRSISRVMSFPSVQHPGLDQVKEHHERRMAKLEELIEQRRQTVEDHENGRRKLSDEEYSRAAKQHQNFQGKLKQMQEMNNHVSRDAFLALFEKQDGSISRSLASYEFYEINVGGSSRENGRDQGSSRTFHEDEVGRRWSLNCLCSRPIWLGCILCL